MKILHTADIHLRPDRDERLDALAGIIETGIREKIDALVICGDLFDADIDAHKLKSRLREMFAQLKFDILIIPGNHDSQAFEDRAFFGSRVKILRSSDDRYETDDTVITGVQFQNMSEHETYPYFQSISHGLSRDKCNILLYHGELLDSYYSRTDFGEEGDSRYMPVRLDFFSNLNFDYVLAGHFHTNFNVFDYKSAKGKGYFVFPGSPVSVTKREAGKRKINIFNTGDAPAEVILESFYYNKLNVKLDPEKDPVLTINSALDKTEKGSGILLTINGYINSTKTGIDETGLYEKLELLRSQRADIIELNYNAADISRILEDDVFKSFEYKLNLKVLTPSEKNAAKEVFLKAMMESVV